LRPTTYERGLPLRALCRYPVRLSTTQPTSTARRPSGGRWCAGSISRLSEGLICTSLLQLWLIALLSSLRQLQSRQPVTLRGGYLAPPIASRTCVIMAIVTTAGGGGRAGRREARRSPMSRIAL